METFLNKPRPQAPALLWEWSPIKRHNQCNSTSWKSHLRLIHENL